MLRVHFSSAISISALPNGLELSRLASPRPVSRQTQRPGWPGRLQRVVSPNEAVVYWRNSCSWELTSWGRSKCGKCPASEMEH